MPPRLHEPDRLDEMTYVGHLVQAVEFTESLEDSLLSQQWGDKLRY